MQCSCGGETTVSTHIVKTQPKIKEWFQDEEVEFTGILFVEQNTCRGCKRIYVWLKDASTGEVLLTRG